MAQTTNRTKAGGNGHVYTPVGRLSMWMDDRLRIAEFTKSKLNYVFPEHFSFLIGEIALYSFVALVATGIFLALYYSPSESKAAYEGVYEPLRGIQVTEAYSSVMELSFSVRAGLLMRQTHHWAALIFLGATFVHMARVFFTGAFRRPRELNWITGLTLLVLAMLEGFVGYSLLDDLLSGQGLRISYSVAQSIPVIGNWVAFWVFGGEFPGSGVLERLFFIHVFLMPAALVALIGAHLALIMRQHHTQMAGPGRTERNVVGSKMWPTYATMSAGFFLIVAGVCVLMGGIFQINPVWLYGPYESYVVSNAAQADYYVLWLQGALRLMPRIEVPFFGYVLPNQLFPGLVFPGIVFVVLYLWPWLEARLTGDYAVHHLCDRPRDHPVRTGFGAGLIALFAVLLIAGSDDVIAAAFDWSVVAIRNVEYVALIVVPPATGWVTWRIAKDLAKGDRLSVGRYASPSQSGSNGHDGDGHDGQPERTRASGWAVRAGMAAAVAGAATRLRRNNGGG